MGEKSIEYKLYLVGEDGELVDLGEIVDADKIDIGRRSRRARMKLRAYNLMYESVWGKGITVTAKLGGFYDVYDVSRVALKPVIENGEED